MGRSLGAVLVIAGATFALAWGRDKEAPDGCAVLMRMAYYLANIPAWSVTVHTSYDVVQSDGFRIEWSERREVTVRRPGRLRIESERNDGALSLVLFDGRKITILDDWAHVYAQEARQGKADDTMIYLIQKLGMELPFAVMQPTELRSVQAVQYLGCTVTQWKPADHIAVETPTADFQMWIARGNQPLPLRVVINYKDPRGWPQLRAQFFGWNLKTKPTEALFSFKAPSGVRMIPFATLTSRNGEGKGSPPATIADLGSWR